jgi:hypothetical protein
MGVDVNIYRYACETMIDKAIYFFQKKIIIIK